MTTAEKLSAALDAAGIDAPARWFDETGSTNAEAFGWAASGAPEFTTVAAGHQTQGRGRLGRGWADAPGGALLASFVLRPALSPERTGLLSLLAGAAMAEAARQATGLDVACKWPNDLLLGASKAGGILAESSIGEGVLRYVVIGVGVNLEAPVGVPGAAGVGADVDPMALLGAFLRRFQAGYRDRGSAVGFADDVRARWRSVAATLGQDVEAVRADGLVIRGRAIDVDERGGLVIETSEGPAAVAFGAIAHLG